MITFNASDTDFSYLMIQTDFAKGTGCSTGGGGMQSMASLLVKQSGHFVIGGNTSTAVASVGNNIELIPTTIEITPLQDDIVTILQNGCQCGGQWSKAVKRTFGPEGCLSGTCRNHQFMQGNQPIGGSAYGNIMRVGREFRLSALSPSAIEGYENGATIEDFGFILDDEDYCVHKTNPIPAPSSVGMSGGIN